LACRVRANCAFQKNSAILNGNLESEVENSPVIHLEGYALSDTEQKRYDTWFNKYGREVFIPLLMKSTGLIDYRRYRFIDVPSTGLSDIQTPKRSVEYPPYLSILTFANIKTFESYEASLELAAFKSAIQGQFPLGLNYKWYVQYQLTQSWRK